MGYICPVRNLDLILSVSLESAFVKGCSVKQVIVLMCIRNLAQNDMVDLLYRA